MGRDSLSVPRLRPDQLTRPVDEPEPDGTGSFQVRPHRFEEVLGIVDTGAIVDLMTSIAVLQAQRRRAGHWPEANPRR
jgi:hypothetical protein